LECSSIEIVGFLRSVNRKGNTGTRGRESERKENESWFHLVLVAVLVSKEEKPMGKQGPPTCLLLSVTRGEAMRRVTRRQPQVLCTRHRSMAWKCAEAEDTT